MTGVLVMAACSTNDVPSDAQPGVDTSETVQAISSVGAVLTQHNDMQRTGLNPSETVLNPNLIATNFGRMHDLVTAGYVYAQPLFVPGVVIGGLSHDVAYVADEMNNVYAFDANTAAQLWHFNAGTPGNGHDLYATVGTLLIDPVAGGKIGISGTPVIDPATNTIYFIALTEQSPTAYTQTIWGLDLTTGAVKASHTITNAITSRGILFDPRREMQRTGLLLWNGNVYAGWGGFNIDYIDYPGTRVWHGWVIGFAATTLAPGPAWVSSSLQTAPFGSTGAAFGGGIWMGGAGLACDGSHIFAGVGEGYTDHASDWGLSLVPLSSTLANPTDWFTPSDAYLDMNDEDMTGVMILPETNVLGHASTLVTADKRGDLFVVDRTSLGHGTAVAQRNSAVGNDQSGYAEIENFLGLPAHFNGKLYYVGNNDKMKVFTIGTGGLGTTTTVGADTYGYMGAMPSISANGTSSPIVWAIQRTTNDPYSYPWGGNLIAYDPTTLAHLYSSSTQADSMSSTVQFAPPTIAGGKVFVPGKNVAEFGSIITPSVTTITVHRGGPPVTFQMYSATRYANNQYLLTASFTPPNLTVGISPNVFTAGTTSTITVQASSAGSGTWTLPFLANDTAHGTWQHNANVQVIIAP